MAKNNIMDIIGMLGHLKNVQEHLQVTQQEIAEKRVEGIAGDGAVKITLTGKQECVGIEISPDLFTNGDVEILQDLLMVAFNHAVSQIQEQVQNQFGGIVGDINLPF